MKGIFLLESLEKSGLIELGRGQIISKDEMNSCPGVFPVYSSSAQNNGEFGKYGKYMFDDERITWSIDGGGKLFYRKKHKYSVTNVCGWIRVLDKSILSTKYLYYSLFFQWKQKEFDYTYKAHPSVIKKIYGIKVIPLDEQIRIVEQLDYIDNILQTEEGKMPLFNELIKSRFIEMFKTIDLSEQKDDWVEIESKSRIITGTTPSTNDESNWGGNILWITPAEMTKETFYVYDTTRKLTENGRKSKSLELMPEGTVLLSTRAPIGKVGIVGKPMACNQGFKNFICDSSVNPIFLYVLLKNNTDYLNSLGSGTTFLEISKTKIGKMKIPVPEIKKQIEFAEFVKLIDKSKFIVRKEIELLQELLESKMYEYFGNN